MQIHELQRKKAKLVYVTMKSKNTQRERRKIIRLLEHTNVCTFLCMRVKREKNVQKRIDNRKVLAISSRATSEVRLCRILIEALDGRRFREMSISSSCKLFTRCNFWCNSLLKLKKRRKKTVCKVSSGLYCEWWNQSMDSK